MSMSPAATGCMNELVARFEEITGKPADLATKLVLSYAGVSLAQGRCVSLRVGVKGGVVVEHLRPRRTEA
jgi:hypothetical protein